MSQVINQNVANGEGKTKQTRRAEATLMPIRIRQKTKSKLELLLRQTNKDRPGRKVKADDLICFSLDLLTEKHLAEICDKMLSNRDRIELLFQLFLKGRRGATREDFLGELIKGRLTQ
jgi:hypothetical protein